MNAISKAPEAVAEIGHNNPPEPTPYEAIKLHIEDLLVEARNWADGAVVETQAQADAISRLLEDLRDAETAADRARTDEKRPHDEKAQEVQQRYNVYIAPLKNAQPGKLPLATAALKAALKPFLDKLEADKRAIAEAARKDAEAKAQEAAAALQAAQSSNLEAREAAEELVKEAADAEAAATKAEADKAHAKGGSRALGLKKTFTAVIADRKAALLHYLVDRPGDITACLQRLADEDVREGKRQIPGFSIIEGTRL